MIDITGKIKVVAMGAIFGFILMGIEVAPRSSDLATIAVDFGISNAMASNLVCDCTTVADKSAAADQAKEVADQAKADDDQAKADDDQDKEDDDKAKEDYDKDKSDANKTALENADKAKEDADKSKEDADKSKEDADKALADVSTAVVGAPCTCADGNPGFWSSDGGLPAVTPGASSAPKALREIHGQ